MAAGPWATEIKEIVMAKVIEFYIPTRFRRPLKAAPQVQFGKIVAAGAIRKTHRVLFADAEISLASQQPVQRSIRL